MATPSSTSSAAAATITNYLELRSPYDYTPELAPGLAFTMRSAWSRWSTAVSPCGTRIGPLLRHWSPAVFWRSSAGRAGCGVITLCSTLTPSSCRCAGESSPIMMDLADTQSNPRSSVLLSLGIHRPRVLYHDPRTRILPTSAQSIHRHLRHGRRSLSRPPSYRWWPRSGPRQVR